MAVTQPIRNLKDLEDLKKYYKNIRPNMRNYLLIHMGVNTALRISDLLSLKWNDIYDFQREVFYSHITIKEKKTKKENKIVLNAAALSILQQYKSLLFEKIQPHYYLFHGKSKTSPLSRSQAFRIIKTASIKLNFEEPVSCHSLRKTFGYHAWKAGVPSVMLMSIYNHSSFQVTKHYLGIEQDDKDKVFLELNL